MITENIVPSHWQGRYEFLQLQ